MFAPWKENYDKPRDCIKKQRHHFADKVIVVIYRCESWTIKKAEHQRTDSLEKTLMLGRIEGRRRRGRRGWDGWMASQIWWMWVWARFVSWWWIGNPGMPQSMGSQRVRHNWATELNWTGCSQGMPVANRDRKRQGTGSPLEPLKVVQPSQYLNCGLLTSRMMRE